MTDEMKNVPADVLADLNIVKEAFGMTQERAEQIFSERLELTPLEHEERCRSAMNSILRVMRTPQEYEDNICKFITETGSVSCVELSKHFGDGTCELHHHASAKIITAFNLSEELADAMTHLIDSARIISYPTSPMIYVMDGCACSLPIAANLQVKQKSWMPTVYHSYDHGIRIIKSTLRGKALKTCLDTIEARRRKQK